MIDPASLFELRRGRPGYAFSYAAASRLTTSCKNKNDDAKFKIS